MTISRSLMERQLRAGGGIMGLEEPRQRYFLGKLVKKAKRAVKKVVKSPIGKAALLGAGAYFAGGGGLPQFLGGKGLGGFQLGTLGSRLGFGSFKNNKFAFDGILSPLISKDGQFNLGRAALTGLGATAIAAPFFMGGEEEEPVEEVDISQTPDSIASIVNMARNQDPSLRFLPKPKFVDNFYAADGGLASMRPGYKEGESVLSEEQMAMISDMKNKGMDMSTIESMTGATADQITNYLSSLNQKQEGGLTDIPREGYESGERVSGILKLLSRFTPTGAAKELVSNMDMDTLKKLGMFTPVGAAKKAGESLANMDMDILKRLSMFTPAGAAVQLGKKLAMKDGGMIDMGGLEKDYREGGFVPIGAEERADDIPARLSKNEFVFTADAVRNAGGGDIDKGAEVMQNMMDNLEAGGTISEESQGMNPAQEMFDQAQMLEGRLA